MSESTDAGPTVEAQLRSSRGMLIGTTILGVGAVAADFALLLADHRGVFPRLLLGTIVLLAYVHIITACGASSIPGFRLPSRSEWKRWLLLLTTAAVALAVLVIVARRLAPARFSPPGQVKWLAVYSCMVWPIYEETIYRVALCTPSAALLGRTGAIITNGLVFAALHVVYGNPDPSNAIAGFLLAWIYLRTRSVLVCITAHAIGNFAINFAPIIFAGLI